MKEKTTIQTPWLLGIKGVLEYLGGIDARTFRTHFAGLRPNITIGKLNYYHKSDVDKFLTEHNERQEVRL